MSSQKTLQATEVKNRFGEYLAEVAYGHDPIFVERHGHRVAVLVGIEVWEELQGRRPQKPTWLTACEQLAKQIRQDNPRAKQTSAVELIRQLREES